MRTLFVCLVITLLFLTAVLAKPTRKNVRNADRANNYVIKLASQGKYNKALLIAQKALRQARRRLGNKHPATLTSINNLAFLYHATEAYEKAEPLYREYHEFFKKRLGKNHINTLISAGSLADLYRDMGQYAKAEALLREARKRLAKTLGARNRDTLDALFKLANLLAAQGKFTEAEKLYLKTLSARQKLLGAKHQDTITTINNLAVLYAATGQGQRAEKYYKRALEYYEQSLGKDHPDTLTAANNLAAHYETEGRFKDAEALYERAYKDSRRVQGKDHLNTIATANNLAGLYKTLKRFKDAETLYLNAHKVHKKKLGEKHPRTIISLSNLADLYMAQKQYDRSEPLMSRALNYSIEVLGNAHPDTIVSIRTLGNLYLAQRRYDEAEPLFIRALHLGTEKLGSSHPDTLKSINSLAHLYRSQKYWEQAVKLYLRGTAGLIQQTRLAGLEALTNNETTQAQRDIRAFQALLKSAYRLAQEDSTLIDELTDQTFNRIQWAKVNGTSSALSQMAVRFGASNSQLARSVRKRQDLVREWKVQDKRLTAALSRPKSKRNQGQEKKIKRTLDKIQSGITEIDNLFKRRYPDYSSLAKPDPLTIGDVQNELAADEALVYFIDTPAIDGTPEETFIWVVTTNRVSWARSDYGSAALARKVHALRCGLDIANWSNKENSKACNTILGTNFVYRPKDGFDNLPFDRDISHDLYRDLFGPFEQMITGKKLLLVPSGPLTSLPFQVLITSKTDATTGFANVPWLIKRHDITILPSVSSLRALRRTTNPSRAKRPFLGVGNPLLTGRDGSDKSASLKQSCNFEKPTSFEKTTSGNSGSHRGSSQGLGGLVLDGKVDLDRLRKQPPLPETADELCAVANVLGGDANSVHLGATATERNVKRLSARGALKNARVVHFATHGLLAGETKVFAKNKIEPSLLLTPPDKATDLDDGLLTASEISQLNLDADWVILSACNTAAGDKPGAEAMSGLAKAFFYAGARALLVSHWAVDSEATVELITTSLQAQKNDPKVGRAGALRIAMEKLLQTQTFSHPAYWAPFIVVGEGSFIANGT